MTTSTSTQQPQAQPQVKDAAAARRRRRRAPAGGAADDCFSCSRKNVKCDRKRPYCSQCLEVGLECSGYKTQLTWGVGVASRGKLRGLSLPVAKSAPAVGSGPLRKPPPRSRSSSVAVPQWNGRDQSSNGSGTSEPGASSPELSTSSPASVPFYGYDYLSVPQSDGTSPTTIQTPWNDVQFALPEGPGYRKLGAQLGPIPITSDPRLSPPLDSTSDGYLSPMHHTFTQGDETPYVSSPSIMYDGCTSQDSPIPRSPLPIAMAGQQPPRSCPSLVYAASDQSSSYPSQMEFEAHLSRKLMRECDNLSVPELDTYSTSCGSSTAGPGWPPAEDDFTSHQTDQSSAQWPSVYESCNVHVNSELIAKMPFFMDYYKTIMAPSMVFIDGPHNPFRDHILQLAVGSQSLQHAICALSACNLRMKRKLSLGQGTREMAEKLMAEKAMGDSLADSGVDGDQSLSEEYQHRNLAVHLLNQQLNDPIKAAHDSVLATILLLCHYRMAESGIAKFHTQFAGVKKILAMRQAQHVAPSGETAWMEAIFTYFDSISATINDRGTQLGSDGRDSHFLPPGAENLVGCERGLFRTISRLSGLNLLSQNRPVQTPQMRTSEGYFPRTGSVSDLRGLDISGRDHSFMKPLGHTYKRSAASIQNQDHLDMYNLPARRFDGNGFIGEEVLASVVNSSPTFDDHQANFWQEWKEVRQALQNWEFDPMQLQRTLPCEPSPSQLRDLGCLSEAFRYAALLYTERLAGPNSPSSSAVFQNLVSQVVYYATSLDGGSPAEKFLLWPLFVAGSECVNDLQRNIVRSKCRDIMARSGYMNNLSALDILENLWAGDSGEGGKGAGGVKMGPFNWTRCIAGLSGEVEWIMF
ncbi:related to acriflavine sensitivity control protein ACR-2 [Cephalotrichum gorgonifer]|uniref:Related to acriflavine sensitivity control protein ACR-2 n=1 Tax=Cephalotrichum gorgonifer TaxID=2041049 RepID=A0AAE8MR68_9PEZI|nr:related to acriflavine sensitivity control protein ACR-2 [Cephalotrichum gorgonifer]